MKLFTGKVKEMEMAIDNFLNYIDKIALIFEEAIKEYIAKKTEAFEAHRIDLNKIEHDADNLRRDIKYKLYSQLLIPEYRGDVLGLLETLDNVIDAAKKVVTQFSIEQPEIYDYLEQDFYDLAAAATKSVVELSKGAKAFFRDPTRVNDHIARVMFWEHEADKIEERLKRKVFARQDIKEFSKKVHIRHFAERISLFADKAEEVSERLAVYAIKRSM